MDTCTGLHQRCFESYRGSDVTFMVTILMVLCLVLAALMYNGHDSAVAMTKSMAMREVCALPCMMPSPLNDLLVTSHADQQR